MKPRMMLGVKMCNVTACDELHWCKGYCNMHYQRFKRIGSTELPKKADHCSKEKCYYAPIAKGLCINHYEQMNYHKKRNKPCPLK